MVGVFLLEICAARMLSARVACDLWSLQLAVRVQCVGIGEVVHQNTASVVMKCPTVLIFYALP